MKRFLGSLYGKISATFLILMIALGVVQISITVDSCIRFMREAEQKLNSSIAENLAREFAPYLTHGVPRDSLDQVIHNLMLLNPNIEVYLLDDSGRVLAYFVEPGKKLQQPAVRLQPVQRFLSRSDSEPISGDDPRQPGRQKVFSAAPVKIGPDMSGYVYVILGSEEYDSALSMVMDSYIGRSTLKIIFIALLFTAIIGLVLFALLTRRFNIITATVRKFAEGNLQRRIPLRSDDEIGMLAKAFNQMASTIESNIEEMQAKDRLRRDLIANISHDLRSPLASIQGFLETILMKENELSPEERNRYLQTIFKNVTQLSRLVSELFELSKLDARQIQPQPEPFSLADLVQDVILKFKQAAEKKHISIKCSVPKHLPFVYGDIGMIERAVSNLMDNALNYTPENGEVAIDLTPEDGMVAVRITDTGDGIPSDDLPHVFERFYRVEKSRTRAANSGAGLGLAITKKIIEAHDSFISVTSELHRGTSFVFRLPVSA